jgi:RNA polymerase sigma-70 factor (ECF subfamily)
MAVGRALPNLRVAEEPRGLDDMTLARAARGDREAFRRLVERYQRPVFALLSRMLFRTGRESLVEDLAQETFVRVFRGLPEFGRDGRTNLTAWILTIATRLCIDELRKRPLVLEPLDRVARDVAGNLRADQDRERVEVAQAIARAVADLSPEFRATFLLREVHDMDYESIAAALGVDVGTVKSRLNRARLALRRALQGIYDEP